MEDEVAFRYALEQWRKDPPVAVCDAVRGCVREAEELLMSARLGQLDNEERAKVKGALYLIRMARPHVDAAFER